MSRIFDKGMGTEESDSDYFSVDSSYFSRGFSFSAYTASSSVAAVEMTRRRNVDRITLRIRGTLQTLDKAV
jgi:hypothetical protein